MGRTSYFVHQKRSQQVRLWAGGAVGVTRVASQLKAVAPLPVGFGLELEANINVSKEFNVRANATYTKAEITDGANKGNKPRRQAPFIYNVVPTYSKNKFVGGFSVIGTSSSFSQDNNKLKFNGYFIVNPFITYKMTKNLSASLNANNIFNTLGITEAEEDAIVEQTTNIIRARSITGRTISATIGFNF